MVSIGFQGCIAAIRTCSFGTHACKVYALTALILAVELVVLYEGLTPGTSLPTASTNSTAGAVRIATDVLESASKAGKAANGRRSITAISCAKHAQHVSWLWCS